MPDITLSPIILSTEKPIQLSLTGLEPGRSYVVAIRSKRKPEQSWDHEGTADRDGILGWEDRFAREDEYAVDCYALGASRAVDTKRLYALAPDAARLYPLRCDFHIHTYYSDGHESPTEMAVKARSLGLDVIAITDHNRYEPSLEAIEAVQRAGLGLGCIPGEEVSLPTWHLLSINSAAPIMSYYETDAGQTEVADLAAKLASKPLAEGLTAEEYALLKWTIQRIRAQGGYAFLCHPYWVSRERYHLNLGLYDQLVQDDLPVGIELLGEVRYENNLLSIAHYHDLLRQGHALPLIGCSDTHGAEHTFGRYWTLALADAATPASALDAIQAGRSVACSTAGPTGLDEGFRAYGSRRWVEYALFLDREFFGLHDALCAQEAQAARQGKQNEAQKRLKALYQRNFG